MKVSREAFDSLLASDGPEISFSLYHECLHSIAFTHAKILSLLHSKFLNPSSPINKDGTIAVQFLPHWCQVLLLPLLLWLFCLYLKPQLCLTKADYQQVVASFDSLSPPEIMEILGISSKHLGCHLHIICSITLLEQFCLWVPTNPPLDFFLHLGGNPMIVLSDILIRDDIQNNISLLLAHVGSPSLQSDWSAKSRTSSHHSS